MSQNSYVRCLVFKYVIKILLAAEQDEFFANGHFFGRINRTIHLDGIVLTDTVIEAQEHIVPYFIVLLFPTEDTNSSGEIRTNSFVIYASRTAEKALDFKYHLAHELFHSWNPKRLGGLESESLYWFSEGFTDYYTSLLLLRANLITIEDYIADYNSVQKTITHRRLEI